MLTASFPFGGHGNTVPYPPLFDDIRRNHGFIDLRGHPARVAEVPEARESAALASLLRALAAPDSPLMSLGCDLGEHVEAEAPEGGREVAGGYVQIVCADYQGQSIDFLLALSRWTEAALQDLSDGQLWEAIFDLQPIHIAFGTTLETFSIWLWFLAAAATQEKARLSREVFLAAIERSLPIAYAACGQTISDVKTSPQCGRAPTVDSA